MTYITNIQKYCIHDGAGIRTTVFFKGCLLHCSWCHNPETQNPGREIRYYKDRCTGCGSCIKACQLHAVSMTEEGISVDKTLCRSCGKCEAACRSQALEAVGRAYDVKQLVKKLTSDQIFYEESGGGVTLSGGEVMTIDRDYLRALTESLYNEGISVNIDTCGFCPWERLQEIIPYVDTFLYDLKALDQETHRKYMGVDNTLILENLTKLAASGAKIWLRLPLVKPVNASVSHMEAVARWLTENHVNPAQINLIAYHDYGRDKYRQLGRTYEDSFSPPSDAELADMKQKLIDMGFQNVKIGG